MLRTVSPNISIITNFGCKENCWYCIWKNHPLKDINPPTDWSKLYDFLWENKAKGKVSVSGGGDCLTNYSKYKEWWSRLFSIANSPEINILVDVHSRTKFYNDTFWKKINRVVITSEDLGKDKKYIHYLLSIEKKIRLVSIATSDLTQKQVEQYADFCLKNNIQYTLKQLVGYDDNGKYEYFKKNCKDVHFLDAGDYNIYYFQDNKIRTKFLF